VWSDTRDEALPDEPRGPRDSDVIRPHESVSGRVVYSPTSRARWRVAVEEIAMFEPEDDVPDESPGPIPVGTRTTEDDFFCIRYRVWYPSLDCAFRTRFQTAEGCLRCDQGRFNLKRHAAALRGKSWRKVSGD
jgi:hypothetical protein